MRLALNCVQCIKAILSMFAILSESVQADIPLTAISSDCVVLQGHPASPFLTDNWR